MDQQTPNGPLLDVAVITAPAVPPAAGVAGLTAANRVSQILKFTASLSPAQVAAAGGAEQIFAVAGILATDIVQSVTKPTVQAGLILGGARVSSAGNIAINFGNCTAATPITPTAAETYTFTIARA